MLFKCARLSDISPLCTFRAFLPVRCYAMGRKDGKPSGGNGFRNHNNVPVKDCAVCGRPFTWRKKWERCWEEVTCCSQRCKNGRRAEKREDGGSERHRQLVAAIAATAGARFSQAAKAEEASDDRSCEGASGDESFGEAENHPSLSLAAEHLGHIDAEASNNVTLVMSSDVLQQAQVSTHTYGCEKAGQCVSDAVVLLESNETAGMPTGQSTRELRRAHKQAVKAQRRALRAGVIEAVASKQRPCQECDVCVDLLVRCAIDESQQWRMLCGRCWTKASGGVPDGDANHPHYRYGGLWKNRAATTKTPRFGAQHQQLAEV